MELGIMVCIVLLLSVAAAWISNKTVDLLERFYFKRPLSMEYAAWLRVMCAGLLLVFIQVAPQFTLLYTLKLVTLINLGIQTMKLNVTNGAIVIHTQRLKSDPGGNLLS
ncbi:hypothetical protein ACVUFU_23355 [Salmonella enterica subsp. enterica serovar Typhimurium]